MNLVRQLSLVAIALQVMSLWTAEPPTYRIEFGSNLSQRAIISKKEFDALINASPVLKSFHETDETSTISIPVDASAKMVRKLLDQVANPALNISLGKKTYSNQELTEITNLASFLNIQPLLTACIKEWSKRLASPKNLQRAVDDKWIKNLPLNQDIKSLIAQEIFNSHLLSYKCIKILIDKDQNVNDSSYETSVRYSPDGRQIASGSGDNTVKIWDAATGNLLKKLTGHTQYVSSVRYSPDGKQIASGAEAIKIWEAATGNLLHTLTEHTYWVNSVDYSPDGKRIVSGSNDRTIKIWDAGTGNPLNTLRGHADKVLSVAYSPDGKQIVSGSDDHTINIWDAATGNLLHTLKGHTYPVNSVAYSPDGKHIVSGSGDRTIKIWDAGTGNPLMTLKGHTGTVWSVAYSPDGKQIVSGSNDRTIKIWDAATGDLFKPSMGHAGAVWSVTYSPDGKQIASGSHDGTIKIWQSAWTGAIDFDSVLSRMIFKHRNNLKLTTEQLDDIKRRAHIQAGDEEI